MALTSSRVRRVPANGSSDSYPSQVIHRAQPPVGVGVWRLLLVDPVRKHADLETDPCTLPSTLDRHSAPGLP